MNLYNSYRGLVGIDEVGRGSVAGPVSVCSFMWLDYNLPQDFLTLKDSKQTTPKKRIDFFKKLKESYKGRFDYEFASSDSSAIDNNGIIKALEMAANLSLNNLNKRNKIKYIYADYGIPIDKTYKHEHIIKGDVSNKLISIASIIAKVKRDALMEEIENADTESEKRLYDFAKNKGYGTKKHLQTIKEYGITKLHRKTFLKKYI